MLIDRILEDRRSSRGLSFIWPDPEEGKQMCHAVVEKLEAATCFDFQDVLKAYASHCAAKDFNIRRDIFCALPPYPATWCESSGPDKMGCLATVEYWPEVSIRADALIANIPVRELPDFGVRRLSPGDAEVVPVRDVHTVELDCFVDWPEGLLLVPQLVVCVVDKRGQPLTFPMMSQRLSSQLDEEPLAVLRKMMVRLNHVWFGFSLLACRNVVAEERRVAPRLQKFRMRQHKRPLKSFYVLNVNVDRKRVVGNGSISDKPDTVKKRLHMVRGHLADYSEGGGLFGKYKGRFWIPAHARGSKDVGEIKKDYRIIAPEAK